MKTESPSLYLVVGKLTPELEKAMPAIGARICRLNGENAREALEAIFAAEHVAVWSELI